MTRRNFSLGLFAAPLSTEVCWIRRDLLHDSDEIHWPRAGRDVNMGSLLKPFLMLAFAATHQQFPIFTCGGSATGCWLPTGHGKQNGVQALANSCNTYFRGLASSVNRAALEAACLSYGLNTPESQCGLNELIGLGRGWPQKPRAVCEAFSRIVRHVPDASVSVVLAGMRRCASKGTARGIGIDCYAKTGTAPCTHVPRAEGDGYSIALFPSDQPHTLVLVQHHNTTGARACADIRRLIG